MTQPGSILANVRKIAGDVNLDFLTDAVGLEWLDEAQQRFADEVLPLDEIKNYAITAKIQRYDLPTDYIIAKGAMWLKNRTQKLEFHTPTRFEEDIEGWPNGIGNPEVYTIIRKQLVIGPSVPTANSATALVSGALGSTATTCGFTAASGTFRTKGWLQIASGTSTEILEYTGVATTTVTGAVRGVHGTSGTAFSSTATVTEIDLQLRYQKIPAVLTATTSTIETPVVWQKYLEKYLLYLTYMAQGAKEKAAMAFEQFQMYEANAREKAGRRAFENVRIKDRRHSMWGW